MWSHVAYFEVIFSFKEGDKRALMQVIIKIVEELIYTFTYGDVPNVKFSITWLAINHFDIENCLDRNLMAFHCKLILSSLVVQFGGQFGDKENILQFTIPIWAKERLDRSMTGASISV